METLIIYTKANLIDRLNSVLSNKKGWSLRRDNELSIFDNNGKYAKLELINPEEVFDDGVVQDKALSTHSIYALHYRNLEMVKLLIKCIDDHDAWINNDFENKNYTYDEFIERVNSDKDWDWRVMGQ